MKKLILFLSLVSIINTNSAQGLEGIIVEKYYISNKSDSKNNVDDFLPVDAVTYRIYIDMKPGYRLQSVYGSPGHELILSTSTSFYNHPDFGSNIPNLIGENKLGMNSVMLDSWIGVGAGSQESYAVLKTDDDSIGTILNINKPPMLHNENVALGIPIKSKDGLINLTDLPPRVTQVGLDSLLFFLDKKTTPGQGFLFTTENGGWGCVGGAAGPDSITNKLCIGQFTTNGNFNFEFNLQIGSPEYGVEQYVARNPEKQEVQFKELVISIPKSKIM